jgi:hypothetical protein
MVVRELQLFAVPQQGARSSLLVQGVSFARERGLYPSLGLGSGVKGPSDWL